MSYLMDKPRSIEKGLHSIRRAANQAIVDAQELLGDIYARGMFGRRKNRRVALSWYRKALANGSRRVKQAIVDLEAS
jgi:TPR repeat protein